MKLRDQIPVPERLKHAADTINNIGTLPYDVLPLMLAVLFAAVRGKLGCQFLTAGEVPSRPPRKTLLAALTAFARTKLDAPDKMAVAIFNAAEMIVLVPFLAIMREVTDLTGGFYQILYNNLAVAENQGHAILVAYYPLIREFAMADEELGRLLAPVEEHLYGAAKEAALTTKDHARLRKEAEDKGHKAGFAAAITEARAAVNDHVKGLTETLLTTRSTERK